MTKAVDLDGNAGRAVVQPNGLVVVPIDYRENALLTQRLGEIVCSI